MVAVQAIRLISGDEEVKALTEGLTDAIGDALGHQTALTVKSGGPMGADFVLKGSVQAAGKRLRLSFGLEDGASATQVWTQRYDRQLDDVFGLQDEIVLHVVAAIRIRVKAQLFERLRGADNATLATPQLLDKAAGIFIRSLDKGGEAVSTLRLAVERAPEHSMARAMLGFGLFRVADYQATAMPDAMRDEIVASLDRAVVLDPRSYFARAMKALVLQDLLGDVRAAHEQASEALKYNANFIPAKGMLGIAEIHLGKVAEGLRLLQEVTEASPDDANQPSPRARRRPSAGRRCRRGGARGGAALGRDARHEAQRAGAGGPARGGRRGRSGQTARRRPESRDAGTQPRNRSLAAFRRPVSGRGIQGAVERGRALESFRLRRNHLTLRRPRSGRLDRAG